MEDSKRQDVLNRLEHVELIFELRHHYCDVNLVQRVGDEGWTHPWIYFDALMYYLLLTCFDVMGQDPEFLPFTSWLNSKKKSEEREKAINSIQNEDPVHITRHLYSEYLKKYGVKNSFMRFITDVLTEEERAELYHSIRIIKHETDTKTLKPSQLEITEPKKKNKFLYTLRNKFTHNAKIFGSPNAGIWSNSYDFFELNGCLLKGYVTIHQEQKNNGSLMIYGVRDWPNVLQKLIKSVLERN